MSDDDIRTYGDAARALLKRIKSISDDRAVVLLAEMMYGMYDEGLIQGRKESTGV
jgi:hypothetical protein